MIYFPAFLDLEGKNVIICGGGQHALEKVQRLKPFHPVIKVISSQICREISEDSEIITEFREFTEKDAADLPDMVISAESHDENCRIGTLCRKYRILFNAVDQQEDCDFIFPAMITEEPLCISISTAGAAPALAVELKRQIQNLLPEHLDEILFWLPGIREQIYKEISNSVIRKKVLRKIVQEAFAEDSILLDQQLQKLIAEMQ